MSPSNEPIIKQKAAGPNKLTKADMEMQIELPITKAKIKLK
jgi:hypothetical protein